MAETLVIFMGLTTFPEIARELIARGRPAETPAMAVRWATRADQETLVGTLETLPRLIEDGHMKPPATIIVGEVVRLREQAGLVRTSAALRPAHRSDARHRTGRGSRFEA